EKVNDKFLVIHEFIKELKVAFDREGIEISWPVRKIVQAKN
ncbi:MAG: mechanosensitive ion channel family protein, partial [Candidatus Diapherotrites archaeon]|nr:mechanosensitive ion channel family protein [Candidatus Diapherotrites archaeon]